MHRNEQIWIQYINLNYNKKYSEHIRNLQQKKMTSILKQQTYRVIVTIHQINISVKFPCSVTAGIRADSKDAQLNKDFKLINNQARVQQILSTDLKVFYNTKTKIYTETRINFLVFLKSSNGRIAAGSATVPIKSDRQHHRSKISIQKCPDKTASIEYSLKMTLVKQQDHNQEPNLSRSSLNIVQKSNQSPSIINQMNYSSIRDGSSKRLKTQAFNSRVTNVRNFDDRNQKQKSEAGSQIQSQAHSRISKLLMQQQKSEVNSQRQKIIQLEREKVRAMKQIRTLKHELQTNSLRNSSVSQSHDQALIMRHESRISMLEDEVEKERGKTNEHQTQSHKRKLKIQQLQKDVKIIQKKYDQTEEELKKQISQKQKQSQKNKELNLELKQLRQKYEDQLLLYENFAKRSQFKQNVYKEQLRTLNEKYTISQTEKQKLLFERNQIINQYEQKNKKEKEGYRNREKLGAQEKSKFIKKADTLQKQLQSQLEQKQVLEQKLSQLQGLNKKQKVAIESLQGQLEEAQRNALQAKAQAQKQRREKKNLQTQLSNIQKMSVQKSSMKKIVEQKQNQILELTKVKSNLEAGKKTMSQKYEEQELQLKQRNNSIKTLQKEIETLKKQNETIKKSQQQKNKQLLDITFIKKNQESKIYGLNEQLKEVQKRYKVKENENNKQIQNLKNKLFQLEEENNEVSEKNYIVNQQLFEYQKNLNELKASYEIKLTQIDKLQAELGSSLEKQESLASQMQELMGIKAQIEDGYEEKIGKLKKKLNQVQNERNQYLNKVQKITKSSQQTIAKLNTQLKNNVSEHKNREKQMHQLRLVKDENEMQILSLTTQLQQTTLQLHKKCKQFQTHKQKYQKIKQQYMDLQSRLKECQFELQTNKNETRIFEENIAVYSKQKQQLTGEVKRSKKQLDKFKSNNQYFLKTFFNILNQSDIPEVINVTHDDSEIIKSMMQVLKKRKSLKQEYDKNMEQLQNFNEELRKQISILDEEAQNKQKIIEKVQRQLIQSKKMCLEANKELQKRQKEFEKEIGQSRIKINEGEKHREQLQRGNKSLSSIIGQKSAQIQKLTQQIKSLQKLKAGVQQKMQGIRKSNQKQIKQLLENTNNTIDELKRELDLVKLQLQTEEKKRTLVSIHNEQFSNQLQVCKQDLFDEQNKNKIANQDIRRLKHQIAQLNETMMKKEKYIAEKQSNYNSLMSQLDDKGEEQTNLRQRMVNYEITIKGLNEKIQRLEIKIMELTEQGSKKKQTQKQLEDQIKKGQNEHKKVLKQLQSEKKMRGSHESKIKEMEQKLKEKEQEIKQQRREIQNLNKKINIISHQNTGEKQRSMKEQDNMNKKNQMKIKEKQKQIENGRVEIEQLKAHNTKLMTTIQGLEKKVNQYELQHKKHSENSSKKVSTLQKDNQNLNQQLNQSRIHLKTLQSNLNELSRNFQNYQIQNNNQIGYLHPILQKLSKLLSDTEQYLKFMNQFEMSKNKIIKISNYKLENYNYNSIGQVAREINIAAQRCKVQIINKSKIPQEDRTSIVEEFKTLQGTIQKIIRY